MVRLGRCSGAASVSYHTVEGSAHSGEIFVAQKGTIDFAPGEKFKVIDIVLIDNETCESTVEFQVGHAIVVPPINRTS